MQWTCQLQLNALKLRGPVLRNVQRILLAGLFAQSFVRVGRPFTTVYCKLARFEGYSLAPSKRFIMHDWLNQMKENFPHATQPLLCVSELTHMAFQFRIEPRFQSGSSTTAAKMTTKKQYKEFFFEAINFVIVAKAL